MMSSAPGRFGLFCTVVLALVLPAALSAQGDEAMPQDTRSDEWHIAATVLAAPPQFRADAEVRKWVDGELVTIREGSGVICIADTPGGSFRVSCYHESLEPFMARGRELRAAGVTGQARQEQRWSDADAGRIALPDRGGMVFNLGFACEDFDPAEADPATGGQLQALYMPYATPEETGLPIAPQGAAPWLMHPGEASAHIMMAVPATGEPSVCGEG